ncbi:MAG TPA: hypothetical protein VKU01_12590 [Bryobacteraceae bacterium]|nr:hypothetical protein [Bryobacteraceae bacterium]
MRLLLTGFVCAGLAAAATTSSHEVTYYKDVLPVVQKNCQGCHRPGEGTPMTFMSYDQTRPWAKAMKAAVLTKKMPPWFADEHYGKFANDRSMSQSDIDTLVAWADSGSKAGNPKDAPQPMSWVEGWRIGKPDMVISMQTPFEVPASGTIDYQYIVIPLNFTEDKYIQMAEARPGDKSLVHHIIAFIREPDNPWLRGAKPGVPFVPREEMKKLKDMSPEERQKFQRQNSGLGDFLAGYAPGTMPNVMKPGEAKLIKAGSDIILQVHYTATGKAGTDESKVGIVFAKEPAANRVLTLAATTADFAIPAGDSNYEVHSKLQLQHDVTLTSMLPHMHFRGKDFKYTVTYPSGEKEELLSVPHYDFNWQLSYDLAQPKLLPKGSVIECVAHYDNSANNKYNPDPAKTVYFGEQTWEEMMFGFFDVSVPMNVTAMDIMAPRRPKPAGTSGSGGLQ